MNWISYQDLTNDIPLYAAQLPRDLVGIVGIPRSGMLVTSLLGLHLGLHIGEAGSFAATGRLFTGGERIEAPSTQGKVLLFDDSTRTGLAMNHWSQVLAASPACREYQICTGCLYAKEPNTVDFMYRRVRPWRIFQWNLFGHRALRWMLCDIDGVICEDPKCPETDTEAYERHLLTARPLYLPTEKVGIIITSRFERWRPQTVDWLRRHNVQYRVLIMYPNQKKPHGRHHAHYKSTVYAKVSHRLMIESDRRQAMRIAMATRKPVVCVENWRLYEFGGEKKV